MRKIIIVIMTISLILVGCTQKENLIKNANQSSESVVVSVTSTSVKFSEAQSETKKVVASDSTQVATATKNGIVKSNKNVENFNTVGIRPVNSSNKGYIASDGNFVYFWSGTSYEIEDGKFCKMKNNGTKFSILSDDMPCSINIIDDTIYFVSQKYRDDNHGFVYRMDKNGGNRTLLINKDCSDLIVTDKYIYFINKSDGDKIYMTDKSGGNLHVVVNKKSSNLQYENGFLYYESNKNQLFKISTYPNSKPIKLIGKFYCYFVHGDNIYFLRDWFPYVYSISTKKEHLLYKERIYGLTLGENTLYWLGYFYNSDEGRGVFAYDIASVSLDGKNIKVINNYNQNGNKISPLYYLDKYVYYGVDRNEGANFELARVKSDGTDEEYLGDYLNK